MYKITRSALYKHQFSEFVQDYKTRAGKQVAHDFANGVEYSANFIGKNPQACSVYVKIRGKEFRKWGIKGFPHSIFFRIEADKIIILEAIYAHRMNTVKRLPSEVKV